MTRFDTLNAAFGKWRQAYFDEQRQAVGFANQFANGFRAYIEAPEFFEETDLHPTPGKKIRYVRVQKAVLNDEKNTFDSVEPDHFFDGLTIGPDGFQYFSIEVFLEMGTRTWPKQQFPVLISFLINGESCVIRVFRFSDGIFNVSINNGTTLIPVFDYIFNRLVTNLGRKRVDTIPEKNQMGFAIQQIPKPDQ